MTDLKDEQITCKICGDSFVFTTGEQVFYKDRGLAEPRRCKDCRRQRRLSLVPDRGWQR